MAKNAVASNLLPTVGSMEMVPLASVRLPLRLLSIRLVFTSSSFSYPSFLNTAYDIRLTAAPPSTSILEIGLPSMWPRMYSGFKC
jgi:hypothetical protein